MQKNKSQVTHQIILFCLYYWLFMLMWIWLEQKGKIPTGDKNISNMETIKQSSFARTMFLDIGGLSTVVAAWIYFNTKSPKIIRLMAAFGSMCLGSIFALPYIGLYLFWRGDS